MHSTTSISVLYLSNLRHLAVLKYFARDDATDDLHLDEWESVSLGYESPKSLQRAIDPGYTYRVGADDTRIKKHRQRGGTHRRIVCHSGAAFPSLRQFTGGRFAALIRSLVAFFFFPSSWRVSILGSASLCIHRSRPFGHIIPQRVRAELYALLSRACTNVR